MKTRIRMISAALAAVMVAGVVQGLQQPPAASGPKETGLAGIKLYDSGVTLVNKFGNPDSIQAVGIGGAGAAGGPGGAGPGAGGPPGGFGGGGAAGGRGGGMGGSAAEAQSNRPFSFGDEFLRQQMEENLRQGRPMMPGGDDEQDVRGRGGIGGPPPGVGVPPGGPGGMGPGGPGGMGGNQGGERVLFTRWVYNRGNTRFGFVLDKYNRVIQAEAISVENRSVRTARGITFGATFADIIKKYGAPDGYEISGDRLMVRYLVRDKVAFQLARLEQGKPQRVTGIVVAAGKT